MADIASADSAGAVTGRLRTLLRLEGLTLFAGMTVLYAIWGGSWWIYAVLFLVPDVSFAAYLGGIRYACDSSAETMRAAAVAIALSAFRMLRMRVSRITASPNVPSTVSTGEDGKYSSPSR